MTGLSSPSSVTAAIHHDHPSANNNNKTNNNNNSIKSNDTKNNDVVLVEPLELPPKVGSNRGMSNKSGNEPPKAVWKVLPPSKKSLRTQNPIRAIVDPIVASIQSKGDNRTDGKGHISLALGDPTAAGNLPPCPAALRAIEAALRDPPHAAGYTNACGAPDARQAVAYHHHHHNKNNNSSDNIPSPDNVIIANGCSGALELALTSLLDGDGDDEPSILLVPQPGFPLYQVIAESHCAHVLHYRLLQPVEEQELLLDDSSRSSNSSSSIHSDSAEESSSDHEHGTLTTRRSRGGGGKNWECDLQHLRELLAVNQQQQHRRSSGVGAGGVIRGIVINNPSNPTGAVFSKRHLQDLVSLCDEFQIPIVADEVYGDLTFGGETFFPLADIAAEMGRQVPVMTASGIGKQYLLPGWRVGWVVFQDNIYGSLAEVEAGAKRLAQVILGASHLAQKAVPALLQPPTEEAAAEILEWKQTLRQTLENQATFLSDQLSSCPGLQVLRSGGAMYTLVRIELDRFDGAMIKNDIGFFKALLEEENVFVLPGSCFGMPNVFRVVFCAPLTILEEATERIQQFCHRHTSVAE